MNSGPIGQHFDVDLAQKFIDRLHSDKERSSRFLRTGVILEFVDLSRDGRSEGVIILFDDKLALVGIE